MARCRSAFARVGARSAQRAGFNDHVRIPQRPPPGRLPLAARRGPADRSDRRGGAARDPAGAARGGRQLQGRQGVHRPGARSRGRSGGPQEPDARRSRSSGSSATRCWRSSATPTGGLPPSQAHPRVDPAARPAGLRQDDDRGQARALAGEAGAASAARVDRRAASGGNPAVERRRQAGGRARARSGGRARSGAPRERRDDRGAQQRVRHA